MANESPGHCSTKIYTLQIHVLLSLKVLSTLYKGIVPVGRQPKRASFERPASSRRVDRRSDWIILEALPYLGRHIGTFAILQSFERVNPIR